MPEPPMLPVQKESFWVVPGLPLSIPCDNSQIGHDVCQGVREDDFDGPEPCYCLCHRREHKPLTVEMYNRLKRRDEEVAIVFRRWLEEVIELGGYERFQSAVHVKRTAKRCLKTLNDMGLG